MRSLALVRVAYVLLATCLLALSALAEVQRDPTVIHEVKHDVSLPLSVMAKNAPPPKPGMVEIREHESRKHVYSTSNAPDPVIQTEVLPQVGTTDLLDFDAINGTQGGAIPPDTNGSVGSTQYVLITNFDYAVYDKTTGNAILNPTRINVIWSGFGGQCEADNGGDPIVLWDKIAQRWLVEQLEYSQAPDLVCVAVSTSADATGSYNRYSFSFSQGLPDYPKISVWPDAYYLSVNRGGSLGLACALDRLSMLAGNTASMICFNSSPSDFSFLASDLDGSTLPPTGAPSHWLELGKNNSSLKEFEFHVDFANPKNSTFTGPNTITVPTFTLACLGACIHQPSPGALLAGLGDRLMYRLAYRNFGDHEAMVVAQSVKPGNGSTADAATRWYELRATPPGSVWTLYQAGTLQDKKISVWMASAAMDKMGNMALGASAVSATRLKPSIGYTGRTAADPLNKLESPKLVAKGTGVQTTTGRWGDYSSMSIDPSDDCTFWYAQEYYKTNGENWITHLHSFKFNNCN